MRRRTILHLIHTHGAGGAETVLKQLVEHLDPQSWRSVVGIPEGGWLWSTMQKSPAEVEAVPNTRSFDVSLVRRILALAKRHRVDLIHTHLFGPAVYATLAAHFLRLPLICTLHGSVDLAVARKWWGVKARILGRSENSFVAVTEALREEVAGELSIAPHRIRVIANGVDPTRFLPERSQSLRAELGWTSDEIIIGCVGNVRHPKGYQHLLQAAASVRQTAPECRFVVLGDTTGDHALYRSLEEQRRDLGLEEIVAFAGFRDDINEGLNNFDIYVMSSTKEGLPLSILQAMAVRLPIVATRCGGPQEILTHDRDALLTDPADPRGLADAILSLVRHPERRSRLAEAAFDAVRSRFTLDRTADQYDKLYRECVAGQS